jgi:hypothetical protein
MTPSSPASFAQNQTATPLTDTHSVSPARDLKQGFSLSKYFNLLPKQHCSHPRFDTPLSHHSCSTLVNFSPQTNSPPHPQPLCSSTQLPACAVPRSALAHTPLGSESRDLQPVLNLGLGVGAGVGVRAGVGVGVWAGAGVSLGLGFAGSHRKVDREG